MANDIQDRSSQLYAVTISCYVLAFIGVGLRYYVRVHIVKSAKWDDHLLVLSVLLYTVYISFVFMGLRYGTGRHHDDLNKQDISRAVRYWYFCEWQYVLTTTVIKVAVGIFYLRIMVTRWQRLVVKTVMFACVIFGATYFIAVILQCVPVTYIWMRFSEPSARGKCLPNPVIEGGTYLHSILSATSDWTLGLLPIAMLWNSQITRPMKAVITFVLSLGALASTSTLVRISVIHNISKLDDFLWDTFPIAIWSTIEPGVALFAAGLASLRPLLRTIFPAHFQSLPLGGLAGGQLRQITHSSFGNRYDSVELERVAAKMPIPRTVPPKTPVTQNYFAAKADTGLLIKLHAHDGHSRESSVEGQPSFYARSSLEEGRDHTIYILPTHPP